MLSTSKHIVRATCTTALNNLLRFSTAVVPQCAKMKGSEFSNLGGGGAGS